MRRQALTSSRHFQSGVVYIGYLLLWTFIVSTTLKTPKGACGQGLIFGYFLAMGLSVVYFTVTVLMAFIGGPRSFYLKLAGLVALPALLVTLWGFS